MSKKNRIDVFREAGSARQTEVHMEIIQRIEKLEKTISSHHDISLIHTQKIEALEKSDEAQISANEFFSTEITKQSEELSELRDKVEMVNNRIQIFIEDADV